MELFPDSTYQIAIWTIVETGLGITAGSLITLALFSAGFWMEAFHSVRMDVPLEEALDSINSPASKAEERKTHKTRAYGALTQNPTVEQWTSSEISNDASSSQEALNPPSSASPRNWVTVRHSFVQTVSEERG
ncbi:pectinesterase precursor [Penicillium maclennaniae]|uniref:pectinesterase precursor n=1 Tax=Penicillium maclennaniae TaxID=1343394 RepID=UPI002540FFF1|nr:pectinesterase precursor [Penicillium maclennaniae]KAJ5676576.1 pectinesterase precursor [Penicillium maclennaniae]